MKLLDLEKEFDMKILFCVERSSHIWGTSHAKSDNDIKAIMYFNPRRYYSPLSQIPKQLKRRYGQREIKSAEASVNSESIDGIIDIELTVVEITKVCEWINKNDPNVFEMFLSPIRYFVKTPEIILEMEKFLGKIYDWYRLASHYLRWSSGNFRQLTVKAKKRMSKKPLKILFVIWRGILSVDWLITHETCDGLPLYLPDLINNTNMINNEMKQLLLRVLNDKVRKSVYVIDQMTDQPLVDCVKIKLHELRIQLQTIADDKERGIDPKSFSNNFSIDENSKPVQGLEKLIFQIIESS